MHAYQVLEERETGSISHVTLKLNIAPFDIADPNGPHEDSIILLSETFAYFSYYGGTIASGTKTLNPEGLPLAYYKSKFWRVIHKSYNGKNLFGTCFVIQILRR
jgi:hypothetical protein